MPQNKRESLIYSVMMCFTMVLWMSMYNVTLHMGGFSTGFFRNYPFLCFPTYLSFASNKRFLQRPYIVRFIIFNRLFVPSTKPLL